MEANLRKETMLDFVECRRGGRITADGDGQLCLIREFLKFALEKTQSGSIATTTAVGGGSEEFRRIWIGRLTHVEPPLPNA